jgi:thiol:disulfide interchange protein DsbD
LILPLVYFAALVITVSAQNPVSVSMSVTPTSIPSGGSGTARLAATIEGGWYMYSITQPPGGPIQTRISLGEGPFKMGSVSGPKPKVKMDPSFGMNTESYAGSAVFNIPFTVAAGTPEGLQTLNASIRYQVCNDTVCLPPKTVKLASAVAILAGKTAASPTPTPSPTPVQNNLNANVNANSNVSADTNTSTEQDTNVDVNSSFSTFIDQAPANTSGVSGQATR